MTLHERTADPDPLRQFAAWFEDAVNRGVANAEAAALATADADGGPSVRFVLVKRADERGFAFFTNTGSRKAADLARNPRAALAFHWEPLGRQVRVEGSVARVPDEEAEAYFRSRPRDSRLGAWASPQSRPLESRAELEALLDAVHERFGAGDVPLPPHWGGYRLVPAAIEFWEHRESRLHDRLRYTRTPGGWERVRLAP